VKARTANAADDGPYNLRSDGRPGVGGYLGDFRRGPAVFTLYELAAGQGRHPLSPVEYLVDVDDGTGPRECCRFWDDPEDVPEWNRAWSNDEWGPWIMDRCRALIANPDTT
jgi:hypothetical protein